MASKLKVEEVREFLADYPERNLLLDEVEFSDTYINLCMDLAVSEYNSLPPRSSTNLDVFPSKSLLLYGTVWQMFDGRATLMARNQLSYTDGGLQIPVEEKYELYRNIADSFMSKFQTSASKLKVAINMEEGWGHVSSDEATFPIW